MFPIYVHDGQHEVPDADIFYIVGKEGIFLKKKIGVMESIAPVKSISTLNSVKSAAQMHIAQIPAITCGKILDFFKKVHAEYRAEAIVLLFYDETTNKYKIYAPVQQVSAAALDYDRNVVIEGHTMIGTIHSHASMSAFHSGVDDSDEKSFDGLHITYGNVSDEYPSLSASIVSNGTRIMVNPEEYMLGIKKTVDIDETVMQSTYKVQKWDHTLKKMVVDEEASKKWVRPVRKLDKRYLFTAPASKCKCSDLWLKNVSRKVYAGYTTGYTARYGQRPNADLWDDHYDPYAWYQRAYGYTQYGGQGGGRHLPAVVSPKVETVQKSHPYNEHVKVKPVEFPPHDQYEDFPRIIDGECACITCLHRDEKLIAEDLDIDLELDYYRCEKCETIVSSEADEPICPKCQTDAHLVTIDERDLTENYTTARGEEALCGTCGNSFTILVDDEECPFCKTPFYEGVGLSHHDADDTTETHMKADSGEGLDPMTDPTSQEFQEEALKQASETLEKVVPMPVQTELSRGPRSIINAMKKVFGSTTRTDGGGHA